MASNDNAWKAFDTSSEAGRLLRQIYGNKPPPVNVPLPRKSKTTKVPTENWRPVSNKPDQVDPRNATRSLADEKKVKVPHKVKAAPSYSRIDFVERRRNGSVIKEEIDDALMRLEAYRPAHTRPVGEGEKERFGEICAHKGGKILPSELTAPSLDVLPSEHLRKMKEAERIARVNRRRAGLPEEDDSQRNKKDGCGPLGGTVGALAEAIVGEIEERREHLAQMESIGVRSENERVIAGEIKARVNELRRLDPRAAEVYGLPDEAEERKMAEDLGGLRTTAPFFRD
jgi:hypothetical protein